MIKYYIGQFFRVLSYITLPGIIIIIIRSFFLGHRIPIVFTAVPAFRTDVSLSTFLLVYLSISIFIWPVSIVIYLIIRRSIYNKHFNEAYNLQLRGTHRHDKGLWDDSDWDKP